MLKRRVFSSFSLIMVVCACAFHTACEVQRKRLKSKDTTALAALVGNALAHSVKPVGCRVLLPSPTYEIGWVVLECEMSSSTQPLIAADSTWQRHLKEGRAHRAETELVDMTGSWDALTSVTEYYEHETSRTVGTEIYSFPTVLFVCPEINKLFVLSNSRIYDCI
jgi:hypothetical protein